MREQRQYEHVAQAPANGSRTGDDDVAAKFCFARWHGVSIVRAVIRIDFPLAVYI